MQTAQEAVGGGLRPGVDIKRLKKKKKLTQASDAYNKRLIFSIETQKWEMNDLIAIREKFE